jgi:hypothetical protein
VTRETASIVAQRLHNQRITAAAAGSPASVVAWMGAVQAQEYGPAKWGLGVRASQHTTDAAVERAFARGQILRTHLLRPTWHFVTAADIRWILELTAPQVHRAMASYQGRLGLNPSVLTRAADIIQHALSEGGYLTRRELSSHLERSGLPGRTIQLAHIVMYAELEGLICSGPRRGKQFTYALLAERAPNARRLPRDEALAELARCYLRSHGPATIRDFVWWSGLKTADAKRGLEMNDAKALDVDGLRYWTLSRGSSAHRHTRTVHLLPIYDEYLVAYRDHHAVPRPAYLLGNFQHALVIGGHVAGTWRTRPRGSELLLEIVASRPLTGSERGAIGRAVTDYGRFLGVAVSWLIK